MPWRPVGKLPSRTPFRSCQNGRVRKITTGFISSKRSRAPTSSASSAGATGRGAARGFRFEAKGASAVPRVSHAMQGRPRRAGDCRGDHWASTLGRLYFNWGEKRRFAPKCSTGENLTLHVDWKKGPETTPARNAAAAQPGPPPRVDSTPKARDVRWCFPPVARRGSFPRAARAGWP